MTRIRRGVKVCLGVTFAVTAGVSLLYCVGAGPLLRLFSSDLAVIDLGMRMMWFTSPFYFTFVCIEIFSGSSPGNGDSLRPTLLTCFGVCVLRVAWVLVVLPHFPVLETVLVSYPISWVVTSILYLVYYFRGNWLRRGIQRAGLPPEETAVVK